MMSSLKQSLVILIIFSIFSIAYSAIPPNITSTNETATDFPIPKDVMTIIDWVLFGLSMLVGLVYVFSGYRIFKVIFFVSGLILFFSICYILMSSLLNWNNDWKYYLVLGISGTVGLLGGGLFLVIVPIGFFAIGALLGLTVGTICLLTPIATLLGSNGLYVFLFLVGFAVVFGIIAVIFQKVVAIIGTSFVGSFMIFNSLDDRFFHSNFSSILPTFLKTFNVPPATDHWAPYVILGCVVVLAIIGIFVQFKATAKNYDHKQKPKDKEPRYLPVRRNPREMTSVTSGRYV